MLRVTRLEASRAGDSAAVAKDVTRAALMGARGNSGVIFSQIARGFVDVLGQTADMNTPRLRRAFRGASDAAYRAVKRPVEGTMLTVIREMAEEGERSENRRLPAPEFLAVVLARGEDALARTPEMLDVLRNAGVVDAGGAGLVEIARGLVYGASGEPLPEVSVETEALSIDAIHLELSEYRYCTVFVVEGEDLDQAALESTLEQMGDSLLVVGDESTLKVHVHTDDPGAALTAATLLGVVSGVEIANMHHQTAQRRIGARRRRDTLPTLETGLVAVCPGREPSAFESLGATRVIEGGQSMNLRSRDHRRDRRVPAAEVIILQTTRTDPHGRAGRTANLQGGLEWCLLRSVQAGLAAMGRFISTSTPDQNEQDMLEALASIATGEVTVASRDAELDGVQIRKGDFLGLVDERAVAAASDMTTVVEDVIARVLDGERGWLAILTGEGAPPLEGLVATIERDHPGLDIEVHNGGQPHYPLLFVAE
jgi:DAK2 domain fusion protein YloV